jgi:NADPH:quinone reductase-like Zn-dependent oxidoreductase
MPYKASLFYGTGRIEIEELLEPRVSEQEVLIRVEAADICAREVKKYKGLVESFKQLPEIHNPRS